MGETDVVAAWLMGILTGDAALMAAAPGGVWEDVAPEGTAYPFIVFSLQAPTDVNGLGGRRMWTNATYQVKGVDAGQSYTRLSPIADRLDVLLHRQRGAVSGGVVLSCTRDQPVRYSEFDPATGVYKHLGGLYRIEAQKEG
jgi:hypothetical protein